MSQSPQSRVVPAGFFGLRTPLLPLTDWLAWGDGLRAGADIADRAEALAADAALLRYRLREVLARPEVREALFVASPDLDASLAHWLEAPEGERGQKVERALVRYFARMAARATPFGLFAGCGLGSVGDRTKLTVAPAASSRRHTRLDMDYLFALVAGLADNPDLRNAIHYLPNSSLYRCMGRWRYSETRVRGRQRSYQLVALAPSEELRATLERAASGASAADLTAALVAADPELEVSDAGAYIEELIASQVLTPDLGPSVTGTPPLEALTVRLQAHPATAPVATRLDQVRSAIASLDSAGLGVAPNRYRAVAALLEGLPAQAELSRLFQVDMTRHAPATLSQQLTEQILVGVSLLHKLAGARYDGLERFRQAFVTRYEGREVPLAEALDEESGIGLGNGQKSGLDAVPLLGGLVFPTRRDDQRSWGRRHEILLDKVIAAARAGDCTIALTAADIENLSISQPLPLPDAFTVMASIAAPSTAALEQNDVQIVLDAVAGPSGAQVLGRFCHADPALHDRVRDLLRAEEACDPEAIFAEVVHLPAGRVGNVLCRPSLRDYEIVFLGQSGAARERQIPLSDLLVSVVDDRVVLRSARVGRRVVPRLTSAHNFLRGLAPYRFLGMLQNQGVSGGVFWDWGPLASAAFLPRVVSGRFVLSRARWRVERAALQQLGQVRDTARFELIQAWRVERGLPRLVLLEDGDNELPIDLENILSVTSFVELVKRRSHASLIELLPAAEQLCATGPAGAYVHELVLPFVRRPTEGQPMTRRVGSEARARSTPQAGTQPRRSFPPGSEWLYARLYAGPSVADQVLREVVGPLVQIHEASGLLQRWFFLRYADPSPHLRVRFQGDPARLCAELLPALHAAAAPLLADGRLWRVQIDTYEREIERYGGPGGVELAEQLFQADSAAVLRIVEAYQGDQGVMHRWRLALCGIDLLLRDLGFDTEDRQRIVRRGRDSYAREYYADTGFKRQIGDKYRQQRANLEPLLSLAAAVTDRADGRIQAGDQPLAAGLAALRLRSTRLAPVVAAMRAAERRAQLAVPLAQQALSYVHMHVNRTLRTAQRKQELVLYECLDRLYTAESVRQREQRG